MDEYYARICWNEHSWKRPSGTAKDGTSTFFGRYGFGMEEWLFDPTACIGGWQYAFLQPVNKGYGKRQGQPLSLILFSIPGGSAHKHREEFALPYCEVLTRDQARSAFRAFRGAGRIKRMAEEVQSVGGDPSPLLKPNKFFEEVVNIRFRPDEFDTLEGKRPRIRADYYRLYKTGHTADLPDSHPDELNVAEGARKQVTVNVYERGGKARRDCLAKWGYDCQVCKMNFSEMYGPIGQEYIHVHHLEPLSLKGGSHHVNGAKDLRPVCPNCHAMLHHLRLRTIDEVRDYLRTARSIRQGKGSQQ